MKKIISGKNDLATTDPELAKEFDIVKNAPLTTQELSKGSNRKVWWICPKGHSFQSTVANRTNGNGCPFCSGRRVLAGYNDLQSTYPEVAVEFDLEKNYPLTPSEISAGSSKKLWWTCKLGHSFQSAVYSRTLQHTGCPICAKETAKERATKSRLIDGVNDLATCFPELAKEFDTVKNAPLTANKIAGKSNMKIWWICREGHSYLSTPNRRALLNNGCPYCSGRNVILGKTDLATTNPELVEEFDLDKNFPLTPQQVSKGSEKKVWWYCKKGHSYESTISSRTNMKSGCPYCSNIVKKIQVGFNDFGTTNPELATEFDYERNYPLTPQDFTKGSNEKIWWICKNGHSYKSRIANRTNLNRGCPICAIEEARKRQYLISLHIGENDLQSQFPMIAAEFDIVKNAPLTPDNVTYGSDLKLWWVCPKKHSYRSKVAERTKGKGCPYCSGQKILVGFNDLSTTHPILASEFDYEKNFPLTPQQITYGTRRKVWWKCNSGHSYQIGVADRRRGRGCPYCSGSMGERFVYGYLKERNIPFEIEKKFKQFTEVSTFPFDVFLPKYNVIIEIDGLQHFDRNCTLFSGGSSFDKLIEHCNIKNQFCVENRIAILRIPFKNVSEKFEVQCKTIIETFLNTKLVPTEILEYYRENDVSNYYEVAIEQNRYFRYM